MSKGLHYVVTPTSTGDGDYYYNTVAGNGEVLNTSQRYASRNNACRAVEALVYESGAMVGGVWYWDDGDIYRRQIFDVTDNMLDELFTYHAPQGDDIERYGRIRTAARVFAGVLDRECPASADRTAAMRQLQDCVMTANRSIACKGKSYR